ncbi:MAG: terminase family protein [Gemmatimonadaceae bacterium]
MTGSLSPVLLPYQQRWIADDSPVKVVEKSRRVGITWAEAADDALYAASANGDDVYYIGYDKDLAIEFVETIAMWARAYQLAAGAIEDAGEVLEDADKEKGILAFKVRFASGHKVVALSSKPRKLRGKQGRVVIDEFAFHDDPAEVLKAAMALTIWGGKIRIISTHNGDENAFNELVNDIRAERAPFSLHRITFDEAIAQGLARRSLEKQGKTWSPEAEAAWREEIRGIYRDNVGEELDCIPRPGGGAFIAGALIQARMSSEIPVLRWKQPASFAEAHKLVREVECKAWLDGEVAPHLESLNQKSLHVFGEDFGRSGDLTVIWPLQIRQDLVRVTPFVVELRNIPFQQQEQVLFYIVDRLPRFYAGKLDARGNGQYLAEVAMQRYGSGRIEQVMLSAEWYREHMPKYKAAYEDAMLVVPRDADILNDHRAIRVERGIARVPEGARTKNSSGEQRHGDSAIAGCLAYAASLADVASYDFEGVPRASQGGESHSNHFPNHADDRVSSSGLFGPGAF